MQESLTVKDVVRYILAEPRCILRKSSVRDIYRLIYKAIANKTFYYQRDNDNKLVGIVIATYLQDEKRLHINAIKCCNNAVFKLFVRRFYELYPHTVLTGLRKGKMITYAKQLPH